jgi:hypothetical protein
MRAVLEQSILFVVSCVLLNVGEMVTRNRRSEFIRALPVIGAAAVCSAEIWIILHS